MGKFDQVDYDSLSPYEQKQYEMDNPKPRTPRGQGAGASGQRVIDAATASPEQMEKIQNNIGAYRAKVGSDSGGRTIRGGTGGGGTGGAAADNKMLLNPRAMKKGGKVKSASARADGIAIRGKTKA